MPDTAFALSITPIATTVTTKPGTNKKGGDCLRHFVPFASGGYRQESRKTTPVADAPGELLPHTVDSPLLASCVGSYENIRNIIDWLADS